MKSLSKVIKKLLPYHHYRNMMLIFFLLFLMLVSGTIALSKVEVDPLLYNQNNVYDYMYVDVDEVYSGTSYYYFGTDKEYVYVYYDKANRQDILSLKTLTGVPTLIPEEMLEEMLPSFQKNFPKLNVKTVDEMKEYVGLYALDKTQPQLQIPVIICSLISLVPLLFMLIYSLLLFFYHLKLSPSLKTIMENQVFDLVNQQIQDPVYIFQYIHVFMLRNYLVINQPVPFVIDYADIQWVYLEKKKFLFFFDREINLVIHDKKFRRIKVLYVSGFSKKKKGDCDDLIELLSSVNTSMIVGYNANHRQLYYQRKHAYEKSDVAS